MIVVDTNVVAYLLIDGDQSSFAKRVHEEDPFWAAPFLWRSEMRNILAGYLRTGALDLRLVKEYVTDAQALLTGREFDVDSGRVLELAATSGCTAYDCEFVCLAERLRLPLVTADKQIIRAFPPIAVSMQDFIAS